MTGETPSSDSKLARAAATAARALLVWVIPGLLALLAVRHLFPSASDPFEPQADSPLAKIAADYGAALWAAFFVVLAFVARYWLKFVPSLKHGSAKTENGVVGRQLLSVGIVVAVAAASALFLRASVFQSYRVLSSSMLPSLAPGAYLAVDKLAYGFKWPALSRSSAATPRRGDLVVFRSPETDEDAEEQVKRVIGLPGDKIGVRSGHPVINDWVVPACLAGRYPVVGSGGPWIAKLIVEFLDDRTYVTLFPEVPLATPFTEYRVKPGEVFVVGDNRAASVDSRAWNKGRGAGLPLTAISGRVDRILLGGDRNGRIEPGRALGPIALELNLDGMNTKKLEQNVQGCLKLRPKDTSPPRPSARTAGRK